MTTATGRTAHAGETTAYPSERSTADGHVEWLDRTRVVLSPVAAPSILGLFGFFVATVMVGTNLAGWWGTERSPLILFPFALVAGGIAQFLAGMWSYKARDGLATAIHGIWGSFWMAYGVLYLLIATHVMPSTPLTTPNVALAMWFVALASVTGMGALASLGESLGIFTVLAPLAVGCGFFAAGLWGGWVWSDRVAGWLFTVAAAAAWYTASAMMFTSVTGRTILPLGKWTKAANVPTRRPLRPIEYEVGEPGIRAGQSQLRRRRRRLPRGGAVVVPHPCGARRGRIAAAAVSRREEGNRSARAPRAGRAAACRDAALIFRQVFGTVFSFEVAIAAAVFFLVAAFMTYGIVRYRARPGREATQDTEHKVVETVYAVGLLAVAITIVVFTSRQNAHEQARHRAPPALQVTVTGFQWCWKFHYVQPAVDITGDCVNGRYPTLALPTREPVQFFVTSQDVIHAFWLPHFRYKIDAFPDHRNAFEITIDRPGQWLGRCAEFCGLEHTTMLFNLRALPADQFRAWLHHRSAAGVGAVGP